MIDNPYYSKLYKYITSAVDMAESLKHDLAKDGQVSDETTKHLATFVAASHEVNTLLDLINAASENTSPLN